jgi:hypothetical protein
MQAGGRIGGTGKSLGLAPSSGLYMARVMNEYNMA